MIRKFCLICKKEILGRNHYSRKYCSLKCFGSLLSKPKKVCICHYCNKIFEAFPCRIAKYCSRSCQFKGMKGKKPSEETMRKIRQVALARVGVRRSDEVRKKIARGKMGSLNPMWRGGASSRRLKLCNSQNYKQWRTAVFERDDWTCRKCNKRGCKLNADHIIPFFKDESLVYDLDNGQTLCVECHREKTRLEMKENWVNQFGRAA